MKYGIVAVLITNLFLVGIQPVFAQGQGNGNGIQKRVTALEKQVAKLNRRITAVKANTAANTNDISQIAANSDQNASRILDNTIAIRDIEDNADELNLAVRRESKCLELRILGIESIDFLYDELFRLQDGEFKEITWFSYTCDDTFQIVATEHTKIMDASAIRLAMGDVQDAAICSDDDPLSRMDLSDLYQNYSQTLQILSIIMKSHHDTLKAIIAN